MNDRKLSDFQININKEAGEALAEPKPEGSRVIGTIVLEGSDEEALLRLRGGGLVRCKAGIINDLPEALIGGESSRVIHKQIHIQKKNFRFIAEYERLSEETGESVNSLMNKALVSFITSRGARK